MLVTISLPWHQRAQGKEIEIFSVDLIDTPYDGQVCVDGYAVAMLQGEKIRLPAYIAARDIAKYLQAQFGAEHRSQEGATLD